MKNGVFLHFPFGILHFRPRLSALLAPCPYVILIATAVMSSLGVSSPL